MQLQKQAIDISFAEGLDTKTDPKRLKMGKFLSLQNSVFTNGGLLQKRNGYQNLTSLPSANYGYLTTFNQDMTAIGNNIAAYSSPTSSWVQKGTYQPLSLSTLSVIRNNYNQENCDIAVAPNGLACCVYAENENGTERTRYVVFDSATGQNIVAPTAIPLVGGSIIGATVGTRVYTLGTWFVIISTYDAGGGNYHLQYYAVSTATPTTTSGPTSISNTYNNSTTLAWDAVVAGSTLYFAYSSSFGGSQIYYNSLSSGLVTGSGGSFAGQQGQTLSLCADTTVSPNIIYVVWWANSGTVSLASFNTSLTQVQAPMSVLNVIVGTNLTSAAQNGVCTVLFETTHAYSYDSTIPSDFITGATVSGGSVSSTFISLRSVGLASKAFIYNGTIYYLAAYQSPYQPTYFLVNASSSTSASPVLAAKLAYQNGGGYLTSMLPNVPISGSTVWLGYLFKDLIQAVNKNTNVPSGTQVAGIYSQTGINMASVTFGYQGIDVEEIGNDLHIGGGFLWMYDGYLPVEHSFFLWPDSIEASAQADPVVTGNTTNLSNVITSVSSISALGLGMTVTGTGIQSGSVVTQIISPSTVVISKNATASNTGTMLTFTGSQLTASSPYYYQVTYEWSDNQGNIFRSAPSIPVAVTTSAGNSSVVLHIPTLRVTMKTANPVKIVIYRWSSAQTFYYQVTSLTYPLINDTTIDSITYVDGQSDPAILGNNLIYTTGGVVEDVNAPATSLMTLFDTRLWLVDAEDGNLVWFSKQVIENTPVEMSDLLTMYIPQSVGTTINTGPIKAIATMDDKILFAKAQSWIYVNGTGPDNTGSNNYYSQPIFITSTVGCTNQRSIVLTPNGLMFQSDKGIWLIGRDLSTSYIGAPVQSLTQGQTVTSALLVPETTQVRFTLGNGTALVYDYFYDQWSTFNISVVSSCIYKDLHTFIDNAGGVHQENPGVYLDGATPVTMSFETGPIRLGDLQNYQRFYFMYLLGTYYSPHFLTITFNFDYGTQTTQTITIQPGAVPEIQSGNLENWRLFAAIQRCQSVGVTVTETYDATLGPAAGQGLSLSGLSFVCGFKKGFRPQPAITSAG